MSNTDDVDLYTKASPRDLVQRPLSDLEFQGLADVPPEVEWFANLDNPNTRRAYQRDVRDFQTFLGIQAPHEFRLVTRAHIIRWRDALKERGLSPATRRRKLAAVSSLFNYLCDQNAIPMNPVSGVKRPNEGAQEGKTPAMSEEQAGRLLAAPSATSLKGKRDRAILATLLYHGIRREELVTLKVKDLHQREGVPTFRIYGKGAKVRYLPVAPLALRLIDAYLIDAGHRADLEGPLFRPVRNNTTGTLNKPLHPDSVYHDVVRYYARKIGLDAEMVGFCVHACRATAITNALSHGSEMAEVQEWAGHSQITTTRRYDRRHLKPENSPSYKVAYKVRLADE